MARYGAALNTLAAEVADIDVVEVAQRVVASAFYASAFMPVVGSFRAPSRQGIFAQQGAMTWAAMNLDTTVSTAPDETAYDPSGRTFTCTGHGVDAVVGQYALADGNTSGKPLVDQIVDEIAKGYVTKFDAMAAATWGEAPATNPIHEIGGTSAALTAPLIDQGIELLLTQGAPEKFALVIYTGKIRELMQIPGMRDRAIRGGLANGVDGPTFQGNSTKQLVAGYGGVLDVYHSDQIVTSSPGRRNMMFAVGDGTDGALVNPWVPVQTPAGIQGQKMHVDLEWSSARRAIEINSTSIEVVQGRIGTSSANNWIVDLVTA